jgi:hypothetical protein
MQSEDYFDFLAPDDIRIKGHRIGIEDVLYEYLFNAKTPDELQRRFHPSRMKKSMRRFYTTSTIKTP